jgi:fumarate reductase subunit C
MSGSGNVNAGGRRPYLRPMKGWWRRDPFFVRYMIREATALIVAAYAIVLLVGVLALSRGEAAWNAWLAALRTPVSVVLHVLMLIAMIYHTYSWFEIMPKTMPAMFVGGKRVSAAAITFSGLVAAVVASLALFALAWMLRP